MELLTIGIQKEGRLAEQSSLLIVNAGIQLSRPEERVDYAGASNFSLGATHLRASDIARSIGRKHLDFGIVGKDSIVEQQTSSIVVASLGFGQCEIRLGTRSDRPYEGVKSLKGAKVATSFPSMTWEFFKKQGVRVKILEMEGSVELAVRQGWADACTDITSSGNSMRKNGVEPRDLVMRSEAVLVARDDLAKDRGRRWLVQQFLCRVIPAIGSKDTTTPTPGTEETTGMSYITNNAIIEALEEIYGN